MRLRPSATAEPVQLDQSFYSSFYAGRSVSDPEALSGVWESRNSRGGAVGIDLKLTTYLPGEATSLSGPDQTWQALDVRIYERASATLQLGEENYFSDSKQGGDVRYEDGHLTLHSPPFDLDLVLLPGERWSGRFHRQDFDAVVVLTRDGEDMRKQPRFVGTWREDGSNLFSCLHVSQQAKGEFSGWFDSHQFGGFMKCPATAQKPHLETQIYGERVVARTDAKEELLLDSPASQAGCCSHSYVGVVTKSGMRMHMALQTGAGGAFDGTTWTKIHGTSCIAPNKPIR